MKESEWESEPESESELLCTDSTALISCLSRESTPDMPAHILVTVPSKASSTHTYKIQRFCTQSHVLNDNLHVCNNVDNIPLAKCYN
jgi:hypothetical protein